MPSDDALGLFQSLRPPSPQVSEGIQAARSGGPRPSGSPDLHSLAMIPGTPGYYSRIPKPPCHRCGEDHVPNHDYGHEWTPEPVHDEPVSASAIMRRPVPSVQYPDGAAFPQTPIARRVCLYVGRGDTYVVAVEEPPEFEAVDSFKVRGSLVMPLVRLARALDVKVLDRTGGDLLMLEQESDDGSQRKPEEDHDGDAARAGGRQPRRQRSGADGAQENQPDETDAAAVRVSE